MVSSVKSQSSLMWGPLIREVQLVLRTLCAAPHQVYMRYVLLYVRGKQGKLGVRRGNGHVDSWEVRSGGVGYGNEGCRHV